jgi:S1-C subfamily serine protease
MTSTDHNSGHSVTVVVHLSGRYRGKIQRLTEDRLRIGTGSDAEIRFSGEDLTPGLSDFPASGSYAVLERRGDTYELRAALEADIWVNGRRTEQRVLRTGDVLEIGEGGPVLRFRVYPPGSRAYKSVSEVFSDCAECARHGRNAADRAGLLLAGPPMELLTRTSPLVRVVTVALMVLLVAAVGLLWSRSQRLERQLQAGTQEVRGLAELLERGHWAPLSEEDVDALRDTLSESVARIAALEDRAAARGRVITTSSRAVVFLQGSWGLEGSGGRTLRHAETGPNGDSLLGPGGPVVTFEGSGPPVEILYTGTGFLISSDGDLLTNRHVALPWYQDAPLELFEEQGLSPVLRRFVGYLPGMEEPFDVELVRASDHLDVALLRCKPVDAEVRPMQLAEIEPRPGDEVIVMGYPAGIQALLARADPETVRAIMEAEPLDFWQLARRLSADGLIEPLATVGVVGQVTPTSVVYDAETTYGGSGGPVLNLDGRVLAVNAAILPQFGGSNLGVPAAEALRLLREPSDRKE